MKGVINTSTVYNGVRMSFSQALMEAGESLVRARSRRDARRRAHQFQALTAEAVANRQIRSHETRTPTAVVEFYAAVWPRRYPNAGRVAAWLK